MKSVLISFFCVCLNLFISELTGQETNSPRDLWINLEGDTHPWSNLNLNNNPGNFQFAIVPDRTGLHRPGVFQDAIKKLNLLQPEFVVSIGDLIEGYTMDEIEIHRQWDEFNGFISKLGMPFFYVPGNHDYTNEVQARIWKELFGPSYYHFIYRNVLFIFLNSEEALKGAEMGGIEKDQYDFVKKVLEDNRDVRWTMVFMHQPLWLYENTGYWNEVEKLLASRPHSVFTGHKHQYVKYSRNNGNYYVLSTAGGISKLRGLNFGEFDHLAWISMTDEGPVLANLMLDGILDENVVTEDIYAMYDEERIMINPVFIDDKIFDNAEFEVRIINNLNIPMWTFLGFDENAILKPKIIQYQSEIGPNSTETVMVPVNTIKSSQIEMLVPLIMKSWCVYQLEDGREIQLDAINGMAPVKKEYCPYNAGKIWVDGNIEEWGGFPFKADAKSYLTGSLQGYTGNYDGSFEFDVRHDHEFLYIGLSVWDDELVLKPEESFWTQDAMRVFLDARPVLTSSNGKGLNRFKDFLYINFIPASGRKEQVSIYQHERLPDDLLIATKKTTAGFSVEIAVPVRYLVAASGQDWQHFRLNIAFIDYDNDGTQTGIWWKPDWESNKNYTGSGMFFRKSQ